MNLEIIDGPGVRARLSMGECIEAMSQAMQAVTNGSVTAPPRTIMPLVDGSGYFAVMPGSAAEPLIYGAKVVSLHPGNPAAGRPVIQGFVALFDHQTGAPVALIDGAEITALRTAAASGLATRLLARKDARTLGLLGCGVQAASHLEAVCAVRGIEEVCVWGRSPEKTLAFTERHASAVKARIRPVAQAREAAACDVICVVTAAREPVIHGGWVRPGAHVNLVGAHASTAREADTALIKKSRLYVDSLASAFCESGDILIPIEEGAIERRHVIGEIGALLLGKIRGRQSAEDITVYKSLGVVAQDLIAAYAVYMKCKEG
jgi:ornithine cyclodeaminase